MNSKSRKIEFGQNRDHHGPFFLLDDSFLFTRWTVHVHRKVVLLYLALLTILCFSLNNYKFYTLHRKFQWVFLIYFRQESVHLSVHSKFWNLIKNYCSNFNQTWHITFSITGVFRKESWLVFDLILKVYSNKYQLDYDVRKLKDTYLFLFYNCTTFHRYRK